MTDPTMTSSSNPPQGRSFGGDPARDRGAILPMVLAVSVVLSLVVVAVATYTTSTLRFGATVESRADRMAAAEAAMLDALERLRVNDELCTTLAGAGQQINQGFPPTNGIESPVLCRTVTTGIPPSDGWAIVVTGDGPVAASETNTFVTTGGGNPKLEGPVFVHDPSRVDFASTTITKGSFWYTDNVCAGGTSEDLLFQVSTAPLPKLNEPTSNPPLKFDPEDRKIFCVNRTWSELFGDDPPVPTIEEPEHEPNDDIPGCRVFSPGLYSPEYPLELAKNNYFQSGNYRFHDLGEIHLQQAQLTFGKVDATVDDIFPILEPNNACKDAMAEDPSDEGATLYVSGSTSFRLSAQGDMEIAGRKQGDFRVALQAIGPSAPTVISADPGGQKDVAFSGLVWAPRSSIQIGTVSVSKDAAFRGGLVVGHFFGRVSNSGNDSFLIRVNTSQLPVKLELTAEATDSRGVSTIRVVADYRRASGDLAVNSWRVCPNSDCT